MSLRSTSTRRALAAVSAAAVTAGVLVSVTTPASAAPARRAYPGSVPSFVSAKTDVGPAADTSVEGEVFLPLRNEIGAQRYATAVSTPGNALYGKFLSPAAWIAKYSPTAANFKAVEHYLVSTGQTIYAAPASRQYIVFRGPASTLPAAFGTSLHKYKVRGTIVTAASRPASLPRSIASKVSGISLGNARSVFTHHNVIAQGSAATTAPKVGARPSSRAVVSARSTKTSAAALPPCASYWDEYRASVPKAYGLTSAPLIPCGYLPDQLRSSANLNKLATAGYDGSGQTIAIIDWYPAPTVLNDTNAYMRTVHSPLLTKFTYLAPKQKYQDFDLCGPENSSQAEDAIDVQSSHSVATGAKIIFDSAFNCGGGTDIAMSRILDTGAANIISNSYGYEGEDVPLDTVRGENDLYVQAAAEGIGEYFSSGDSGDNAADLGYSSPDFAATSPFVTAVGGTSQAIGASGALLFQTGWGTTFDQFVDGKYTEPLPGEFDGGAGGGVSTLFAGPAYQRALVPASLRIGADGTPARVVPDVADLADPYTGFQIAISPIISFDPVVTAPLEYDTYGGTSLAAPIVAAKVALLQQITGRRLGLINPAIYAVDKAHPAALNDVRPQGPKIIYIKGQISGRTFVATLDKDTSLKTTAGYDDVTGLGSLNVAKLAALLPDH